jgi:hypothetical protein
MTKTTEKAKAKGPRIVKCIAPGVRVEIGEHGHQFAVGDVVDLDTDAAPGLTWREALGPHLEQFESAHGDKPTVGKAEE